MMPGSMRTTRWEPEVKGLWSQNWNCWGSSVCGIYITSHIPFTQMGVKFSKPIILTQRISVYYHWHSIIWYSSDEMHTLLRCSNILFLGRLFLVKCGMERGHGARRHGWASSPGKSSSRSNRCPQGSIYLDEPCRLWYPISLTGPRKADSC